MFDKYLLGKNIREAREHIGLTQTALAEKLFVSFQAVSSWERGVTPPETENICRLSEIFGVPVDHLLFSVKDGERLFVGIDGGGTKTELVLFSESSEVLKKMKLSGGNPNNIGVDACERLLCDGIERLCSGGYKPVGAFAGIAGGESSGGASKIVSGLKKQFSGVKFELGGDFLNVLGCAENPNDAMGLICGTGITVVARKLQWQTGRVERIGGWGFLFDEGGSGYNIGNDALRHALLCADGLCDRTLLYDYIENEIGDIKKALGEIALAAYNGDSIEKITDYALFNSSQQFPGVKPNNVPYGSEKKATFSFVQNMQTKVLNILIYCKTLIVVLTI